MLLEKIENIRNKPLHIRNQYAFFSALLITVCIAVVWGYITFNTVVHTTTEEVVKKDDVPSSLSRTLGEIKIHIQQSIASMRTSVQYVKTQSDDQDAPKLLDLDALYASSSKAKMEAELRTENTSTSSTSTVTLPTSTYPDTSL